MRPCSNITPTEHQHLHLPSPILPTPTLSALQMTLTEPTGITVTTETTAVESEVGDIAADTEIEVTGETEVEPTENHPYANNIHKISF